MVRGPKARALAAALRRARKDAGVTLVDLAGRAGMSKSVLDRIENNKARPATPIEVARLLVALNITGPTAGALAQLAEEANTPNWLATGVGVPLQVATLVDYEENAERITAVTNVVVPGLLQTEAYAREVLRARGVPLGGVEPRVWTSRQRQAILTRENPVALLAIIDEPAIRRVAGGPRVAAEQLRHIVTMAGRPNVTVQIIPYSIGVHAAMAGSFELIELPDQPPVVHTEHAFGGILIEEDQQALDIARLVDRLRRSALSPEHSVGLIHDAIRSMERT